MVEPRREKLRTFMWWTREVRDGMSDLIVKAVVKDVLSDHNVSADFYDALNEEVTELLDDAAERAEANDRKTVQPRDL
jgi:histone H3/H4